MKLDPNDEKIITEFKVWLVRRHACLLHELHGEWELVRWTPADDSETCILYTNKRGELGKCSSVRAAQDWSHFKKWMGI